MNNIYLHKYNKYKAKYDLLKNFQAFHAAFQNFNFTPEKCDKDYFDELEKLMNLVIITNVNLEMTTKYKLDNLKITCDYHSDLSNCIPDNYDISGTIQILLGRFNDNIGCFFKCHLYFSLSYSFYSIFKNDLLLKYILRFPHKFNIKKPINILFPFRILISDKPVPSHDLVNINDIHQYTGHINPITHKFIKDTLGKTNEKIIKLYKPYTTFFNKLSNLNKPGMITSRELCSLFHYNYYFYIAYDNDEKTSFEPFILVSKYNLDKLKEINYNENINMDLSKIIYLFNKN